MRKLGMRVCPVSAEARGGAFGISTSILSFFPTTPRWYAYQYEHILFTTAHSSDKPSL